MRSICLQCRRACALRVYSVTNCSCRHDTAPLWHESKGQDIAGHQRCDRRWENGKGLFFPNGLNGAINGSSTAFVTTKAATTGRKLKVSLQRADCPAGCMSRLVLAPTSYHELRLHLTPLEPTT